MKLSIIVPAHNEEDNIGSLIDKIGLILKIDFELLVVNDHSSDSTTRIVLEKAKLFNNLRLIENKSDAGFGNTLRTGFANASGDFILPLMADLCDDLDTISIMYEEINKGYDVVCGSRYIKGGARIGGSNLKGILSSLAGWSAYYLLGISTHDIANAFKMYRKKVIDSIDIEAKGFEISMELPLKAYYAGFKITEVPTVWRERKKGKSSFRMFNLVPNYLKIYLWAIKKRLLKLK
ncbi:MAG: glycosyltransferase [Candidatus Omnitrophota bacterium]|nr:glycosyltransferase [Candidatus Omnitrophota bacterium]